MTEVYRLSTASGAKQIARYNDASAAISTYVTGGTLYSDAQFYYRVFTTSSSLVVSLGALTADILVVAGGGGGGYLSLIHI